MDQRFRPDVTDTAPRDGASQVRRVVLADDHPLFRAALTQAVRRAAPSADIVEAGSLQDARAALQAGQTDLLCLDLHMSDSDGFAGLTELRADHPAVPVAVISASQTSGVAARALEFGAAGFIPKTSSLDELCEALSAVLEGEIWAPEDEGGEDEALENAARLATLTPAQMRVLRGLTAGRLNKQIAYDMSISEATVKAHVTAVFRKLGVINRTQAVLVAQALQVEPPAQT